MKLNRPAKALDIDDVNQDQREQYSNHQANALAHAAD